MIVCLNFSPFTRVHLIMRLAKATIRDETQVTRGFYRRLLLLPFVR
jgi:hypothetical protein